MKKFQAFALLAPLSLSCGPSHNPDPPLLPGSGGAGDGRGSAEIQQVTLADVGLDAAAMDTSANACENFYQFSCGGWLEATEIPADKSRYGRFTEIHERNERELKRILEGAQAAAARADSGASPAIIKLGTFYGACMNEEAIEAVGLAPTEPLVTIARSASNTASLDRAIASLHRAGLPVIFSFESTPDFADATMNIANLGQGGLGLPDRDYYLSDDEKMVELRKSYRAHVERMMMLGGLKKAKAARAAADIMRIETELAKVSKTRVERRDPKGIYNPKDRAGLVELVPSFPWDAYLKHLDVSDTAKFTVESPEFMKRLETLRKAEKGPAWQSYLHWHVLRAAAPHLSKAFVEEDFKMKSALSGAQEIEARWKRCISMTDRALGELLAQPYLETMFGPEAKTAADSMVEGITGAFRETVTGLEWMTQETRDKALAKLGKVAHLVGYPDEWREYGWEVTDSHAANSLRSRAFENARDLAKIGKPYDRSEWYMSPQTVNAYYNPLANQMVFPAGILQTPFFNKDAHVAVNLGAMGMIVGHELTHGFDDSGAQFDGDGNLKNWWAEQDAAQFKARGECVEKQYAGYSPIQGANLNGKLTLGENIADIGGVKLAFQAYRKMRAGAPARYVADGWTEDQQFFIAVGQAWCSKAREEEVRRRIVTDPHSPPEFRVIGSLANLPEFAEAFQCESGAMKPESICDVW